MTAHLDALVRELADAVKGDPDDLPVRLRKAVVDGQSPLAVRIGGSTVAVPVQATGPIPVNGTVVWVLESGPRRVMLDANRAAVLSTAGDAGWTTCTLQNAFTHYADPWGPAQYRKDALGYVHLRGLVQGGSAGAVVFTLPVGYRPARNWVLAAITTAGPIQLRVHNDGTVTFLVEGTGQFSTDWASIAVSPFLAEQ